MSSGEKVYLSVEIPVAGDGFPNEAELNARNKIIDELDRRKLGDFVGAGGGMGAMDFSYIVSDEPQARQMINEVVRKILPGKEFAIEASSAEGIEPEERDDDGNAPINWPLAIGCLAAIGVAVGLIVWLIWSLVT
jgi:hypothetical protein